MKNANFSSRLVTLFFCCGLPSICFAQAASSFSTVPLPDHVDNLRQFIAGHDLSKLAKAARALPQRREFESTTEFVSRLQAAIDTPVYGDVRLSDRVVVTGPLLRKPSDGPTYDYEADAGTLRVCLPMFTTIGAPQGQTTSVLKTVQASRKAGPAYAAQNGFGARTVVATSTHYALQVRIPQSVLAERCMSAAPLDPSSRAPLASSQVLWGVSGRLMFPYITRKQEYIEPTLRSPSEAVYDFDSLLLAPETVFAFNVKTGDVIYQAPFRDY